MTAQTKPISIEGTDCLIAASDGAPALRLPFLWLRDHCPCPDCLHPETRQRQVDTFAIPADLAPRSAETTPDGALEVVWQPDGHVSRYDRDFLTGIARDAAPDFGADRLLWDARTIEADLPQVSCEQFMRDDRALGEALIQLERYGFVLIEGVEPTPAATEAVARRITYIRETIFGGFWDFTANMEHKDTAYTTQALGMHTDGTYSFDAPGYQMFHCLAFDGTGGESLLADGFRIAETIRQEAPDLYRVLAEVEVPGQYIDHERGVHLVARLPIFRHDGAGRLVQVRYNNHDRAPFLLEAERMAQFYRALAMFDRLAHDEAYQLRRRLAPGEMLIFDNWRTLHGRAAYQGFRRLAGAYLNKEDVESRLRVLRLQGLA